MSGLLDGDIAELFGDAFGDLYLDGALLNGSREPNYVGGRITGYTDPGATDIKVQVDKASWSMMRSEKFIEGDVRLIILAKNVPTVTADNHVTVSRDAGTVEYRLVDVSHDAALSHWICHARKV